MNILTKKLGVEVEFVGANLNELVSHMQTQLAGTGIEVALEGYNHNTRDYWKIVTDATVSENRFGGNAIGGELVSPPLMGAEMLRQLEIVLVALNSHPDVSVDRRCGVHVHMSWDGMEVQHIKNVVQRYADFEPVIDSWMAPSRRGNRSQWCATIVGSFADYVQRMRASTPWDAGVSAPSRYHKVNIAPLSRYETIEFRQHQGSTDFEKIANWMKFLAAFVDASQTMVTGANLNYRRQRKIAYGEIREQVAAQGWTLRFANTGYKLIDPNGDVQQFLTMAEMDAMYDEGTRSLNDSFSTWFAGWFNIQTDSVFRGVDASVQTFLEARIAHFAA